MPHPIVQFILSISPVSETTQKDFANILKHAEFPKNKELLSMGQVARNLYFIVKGLARVYYFKEEKDITDYFAIDGQLVGAVPSLFTGQPTKKAIHLIEDSEVYYFSAADFEELCNRHHDLERAARKIANYALIEEQQRIESMRFYSARERYTELEKKYPGITNRCPLQYIASYLGTTQVSISRIRSGIQ